MKVAAVQTSSGEDKHSNIDTAIKLARLAAEQGAQLIVLPECLAYHGRPSGYSINAEPVPGPTIARFAELAKQYAVAVVVGTIPEVGEGAGKSYNTSVLIGPDGTILGKYRKIHLFDVSLLEGVVAQESDHALAGSEVVVADVFSHRIGMSVCYDLRFPELFRELSRLGADVIVIPSAFTSVTGKDHWEIMVRARAIENQCFVVAANQFGPHVGGSSYGRSMVVDPWGRILAEAPDGIGLTLATLDFGELLEIRKGLPALANRRFGGASVERKARQHAV